MPCKAYSLVEDERGLVIFWAWDNRSSRATTTLDMRGAARPDPTAPPTTCLLELDGRAWTLRLTSGRVQVQPGVTATADASLRTDPKTLSALLTDPATLASAAADGSVAVVGDLSAISRLLHSVVDPWPSGDQTGTSQGAPSEEAGPHA
jgi:SCP-2 sterol transfer family